MIESAPGQPCICFNFSDEYSRLPFTALTNWIGFDIEQEEIQLILLTGQLYILFLYT